MIPLFSTSFTSIVTNELWTIMHLRVTYTAGAVRSRMLSSSLEVCDSHRIAPVWSHVLRRVCATQRKNSSDNYFVTTVGKNIHWHTSQYFHVACETPLCLSCPSVRTKLKICSSRFYNDNILIQGWGQAEVIIFSQGKAPALFRCFSSRCEKAAFQVLSRSFERSTYWHC